MTSSPLKAQYDAKGYVIAPGLITPEQHTVLEEACEIAISKTRSGEWSHRRTVGKQFPPYGDENSDSWGVQHIMHPQLGLPAFAKWYTSDPLVDVVTQLLDCQEENLQMELFNLLINPVSHDFALRWHRDDVKENATEAEELEALLVWHHGVQWNTALYTDACLFVVPKLHKLPRTPEQRLRSSISDPPTDPFDMPGATQVILQPGETVFYNSNILHCATYDSKIPRATLHGCMGNIHGGSSRARNVLQHGLNWMKGDQFRASLDDRGKAMLSRLIAMQESVNGDLGFSLAG